MLLQIEDSKNNKQENEKTIQTAIGIDLGTTNSIAACITDNKISYLTDLIPSVVQYTDKEIIVGKHVQKASNSNHSTISSIKSLMGKNANDIIGTSKEKLYPIYAIKNSKTVNLKINNKITNPVAISADILKYLKKCAEAKLDRTIDKIVLTVPAYFDDAARNATRDAAKIAGLDVIRLINEPTAAALAYGLDNSKQGIYGIYDLGGGTFDFSLLKLQQGVFQVIATDGDINLGGDDFDILLLEYIIKKHNIILSKTDYKPTLIKIQAIKESLSKEQKVTTNINNNEIDICQTEFINIIQDLVKRTLNICDKAISYKQIKHDDLQGIVLVGGSTKIPFIHQSIKKHYPCPVHTDIDPDRAVCMGAAIQAYNLSGGKFSTNKENPLLLLDITPLSLGIETMGGLVDAIIERNTPIPVHKTKQFTTYQDGQTKMKIHVTQGEREMVKDCRSLGEFELSEIPPMTAGMAKISITFKIDADGLLTVSAQEETTKKVQKIAVKPSYGISEDMLEKMIMDSLVNAKTDVTERLLAETKIRGKRLLQDINSAISCDKDLLSDKEFDKILILIDNLEKVLLTSDKSRIENLIAQLEKNTSNFAKKRIEKSIDQGFCGKSIKQVKDIVEN